MNVMNEKKGFTLVELMIGIVLAMLVLGVGYVYFAGSQRTSQRSTMHADMLDNVRMSMDVVTRFFRKAGFNVNFKDYTNSVLVIGGSSYGTKIVHVNSCSK
jgi:Tfp pilus assembly protein PilW